GSLYETHLHADPILPAGLKWHQSHSTPAVRVPGVGVRKASPRLLPLEGRLAAVPAVSAASAHTRRRSEMTTAQGNATRFTTIPTTDQKEAFARKFAV